METAVHTGSTARAVPNGAARSRLSTSFATIGGRLVLVALSIDLAGTKWGSYLPTPIGGLYLPDATLGAAAAMGGLALLTGFRASGLRRALLVAAMPMLYVGFRVVQAQAHPPPSQSFWVRDMAPFAYLAMIPLLVVAAQTISFGALVRTVRWSSGFLAVVVGARMAGIVGPVDIGTEVPIFSERHDVENVVLGLGVLAFGGWGRDLRPRRAAQGALVIVATLNYSRAGLLAMLFCLAVSLVLERRRLRLAEVVVPALLVVASLVGLACVLVPGSQAAGIAPETPQAVHRLLGSDVDTGTTGARVLAWKRVMRYTVENDAVLLGSGPGTNPVRASGAVAYLSGADDVRNPESWPIGAIAYHGLAGFSAWLFALWHILRRWSVGPRAVLPAAAVVAYCIASLFGVVVESPFGSLPIAVFGAWLVAARGRSTPEAGAPSRAA